ncbi:nuclear transport factor 2 family protein [Massilia aquatica]|uniref:Nuclear transport factor 2 family protein n=1 Tax=Massilia aquatica TaxID=2609000 RepID=A0ABX0MBX5_9BURK|nr:nuclear transport factor 2 family protein [Massilia aquatica]NHZ44675.1 nuclear transport factor 2 family protein [Massilia aquatica]
MKETEKHTLIARYLAAYNAFDIDGMMAVLSPEVEFENYSQGTLTVAARGADEFKRLAEQSKTMFSEREQRITELGHAQDCVVASIAYRGRLCLDIPDGPAAGSLLELSGRSEFSFDGDRINKIVDHS